MSNHRPSVFRSFITEELYRYKRNCSYEEDYLRFARLLEQRLSVRGYPYQIFSHAFYYVQAINDQFMPTNARHRHSNDLIMPTNARQRLSHIFDFVEDLESQTIPTNDGQRLRCRITKV